MQIHISMNSTEGMKSKQKFVSLTVYHNEYSYIGYFIYFCIFLHRSIFHKCIKVRGVETIGKIMSS